MDGLASGLSSGEKQNITPVGQNTSTTISNLPENFNFLPLLVSVLKEILPNPEKTSPQTRIGDVSSTAIALKDKFDQAFRLVDGLPGIDLSVEQQKEKLVQSRNTLKRKRHMAKLYREMLFPGTDDSIYNEEISAKRLHESLDNLDAIPDIKSESSVKTT